MPAAATVRPFQILIAEDNTADVRLVREALKEHQDNCNLHVAADGAQAISLIRSLDADPASPGLDLVLLDLHLPKRSGEELLTCIRSTTRHAHVPVVIMTGVHSSGALEKAARFGAIRYFEKPATLDGFLGLGLTLREILEREGEPGNARTGGIGDVPGGRVSQRARVR